MLAIGRRGGVVLIAGLTLRGEKGAFSLSKYPIDNFGLFV
jgi:hypothetical protein